MEVPEGLKPTINGLQPFAFVHFGYGTMSLLWPNRLAVKTIWIFKLISKFFRNLRAFGTVNEHLVSIIVKNNKPLNIFASIALDVHFPYQFKAVGMTLPTYNYGVVVFWEYFDC